MTTNPNNAVGTNAAYSGRTSVNAFNDDLAAYSRGILTGWNCQVDTGLTVILGGGHSVRDVAIAEDNAGNKTTINNISLDEVPVTLDTAPGANSRIDAIVAYVDNPPQGSDSTADNPEACGIIPVAGTPAVDPQAPDDNAIRTAITADGASGTTAYYVVLATVTVPTGTTDLIPGYIQQGDKAVLNTNQIADSSITSSKIDFTTMNTAEIKSTSASIGYSVICAYRRLGNIVIAIVDNPVNTSLPADADNEPLIETIPVGFRPAYNTSLNLATGAVQSRTGNISFLMKSDGSIRLNSAHMGDGGATRLNGVSVWFTSDAYPN